MTDETIKAKKSLVLKRGVIKGKLSRFITFLDAFSEQSDIDELQLRLTNTKQCLADFEAVQDELELIDEETDHSTERNEFECQYFKTISNAEKYIKRRNANEVAITGNSSSSSCTPCHGNGSNTVAVRLPSINLPTFSGKFEEWMPFIDAFNSLIDHNDQLSDIQKLQYLKGSLKGQAVEVLQSLEITAANYEVALGLLKKQYHNNRLITTQHIRALFELPIAQRDNPASLRQLVTAALTHMRALTALNINTENWDPLISHLITSKLDHTTHKEWELTTQTDELPSLEALTDYLLKRSQTLETVAKHQSHNTPSSTYKAHQPNTSRYPLNKHFNSKVHVSTRQGKCHVCGGSHTVFLCNDIRKGSYSDKVKLLNKANVCINCLSHGHSLDNCKSGSCKKCSAKHHTILHPTNSSTHETFTFDGRASQSQQQLAGPPAPATKNLLAAASTFPSQRVLLNTAFVQVIGPTGRAAKCRALIDNGSESCFITENIVQLLGLRKRRHSIQVSGVNQTTQNISYSTEAKISSLVTNYQNSLSFLIIPKITGNVPSEILNSTAFKIPNHITLADPSFSTPGSIDLLIGQEIFWDLICIGQIKTPDSPILQKTKLGWIVGGRYEIKEAGTETTCHLSSVEERVDKQLQTFWQLEEQTSKVHLTAEELSCEAHYEANTKRDSTGRYIVSMPLRGDPSELGDSKDVAVKRLEQVERRLARNPELSKSYSNFMNEYIELGHMKEINTQQSSQNKEQEYYLPHHPVIKEDSSTTKVRVVFDASAKTTTGISLNDIQLVGPVVQSDLFSIMLRFRLFTYVMTADLEKMYRQIEINQSQTSLLKVVWRDNPSLPVKTYKLQTVTYGTASAPYLATRTLNQLAADEGPTYPEAAKIVQRDFYVDDLLTGAHNVEEGLKLQKELILLLSKGHFNLRKWNSNSVELLSYLHEDLLERKPQEFTTATDSTKKTLGLWWDAERDVFVFKHSPTQHRTPNRLTKRTILSEIARLFDPLGLVAPVVIRAKVQLQELWKLQLAWDESLPMHLHTQWTHFLVCLHDLNLITIKRQTTLSHVRTDFEIHGFSDASEKAYGAAVYLKHQDSNGNVKVSLFCSKSRVAPLKTVSLPRLELCAAVLLCELISQVVQALSIDSERITYWTDSTVVLAWIAAEPARWTTFVANRVSRIQEATGRGKWRHVGTDNNPADLISRGTRTKILADSSLWWNGPSWLSEHEENWPNSMPINKDIPEQRSHTTSCISVQDKTKNVLEDIFHRKSSFGKITRILAYCLRFISNTSHSHQSKKGPLSVDEVHQSTKIILKYVQKTSFPADFKQLSSKGFLSSESKLQSLAPFIDDDGLIRVGGRLQESSLSYEHKHPILLPKNHRVTELIARQEHLRHLHCGPQALMCAIREQYWPINGRDLVRKITHQCLKCFRARPKFLQQKMGSLPSTRVTPARPFLHTGVDYCGPFLLKQSKRRGTRTTKVYTAVFVCLATKAVHLELVSDLSTDSFLGALRRFIARRGICKEIFSDNGKNFIGANRELKELYNFFTNEALAIVDGATTEGIKWSFIPPYAPHMGGLWEAAVKSFKHHFKRIVGTANLTFEEFTTVLTQIEAVLNSRPLTPLSNDPSDLSILTPAHFLIGGSLKAPPEPSVTHLPEQRLSRWQRVQQLVQHFWSRWSSEYLTSLQQRSKWKTASPPLQVGSMVLLKDDHLPPLSWPMGRVVDLHPGKDNLTRVVTVKTAHGAHKRSIHKLCLLPIDC